MDTGEQICPLLFPVCSPPPYAQGMAKRKFGNIEKRASGRYRARYRNPDAPEQWVNAPRTYESKDDAAGWLRGEEKLIEFGDWTHPDERSRQAEADGMTVKELCEKWLSSSKFKPSTARGHRHRLEGRVYPYPLADMPVVKVDRRAIKQWWQTIDAEKFVVNRTKPPRLTPATNSSAFSRLRTAFEYAKNDLEIIDINPVVVKGASTPPRPESRDRPLISLTEATALIEHASKTLKAPVALLLWSGLRLGELLELRRADLDGLDGDGAVTVKVRRNAQRIADPETGKQVMISLDTPKSNAGSRDIPLPGAVGELVREHAAEYMADGPDALVVTTRTGTRMFDTGFRNRWNTIAEKAGRPDITPHDCRRFYGTMLVDKGRVSLEEARRLMGHERVDQLMEYQRALDGYGERAAEALNELIAGES